MHVESIDLIGFMVHDEAFLEIPRAGTVLITGTNGTGKSSFAEGVAWVLWGKMLRGTKPWRPKQLCMGTIRTDRVLVTRKRTAGGRISLEWSYHDSAAEDYDTPTKAQEALDEVVGTFDTWRKTHVLTSADASSFTEAGDAQRKRLLESLLGIESLDAARDACREERKQAGRDIADGKARIAYAERGKLRAQATLQELQEPDPLVAVPDESLVRSQQRMLKEAQSESKLIEAKRGDAFSEKTTQEANLRHADKRLERIEDGQCPTCTQEVPKILVAAFRAQAQKEHREYDRLGGIAEALAAEAHADLEELREEVVGLQDILRDIREKRAVAAERERGHRNYRVARKGAQDTIEEAGDTVKRERAALEAAQRQEALLKTVQAVFGMKGFRAQLLGDALGGIEHLANTWLQMLSDGMALELATDDKGNISISVDGVSGGQGYFGSSTGERRRIDVALLLALADVSASVRGTEGGTLFLDEVFDGLDEAGQRGVGAVLQALAEDRGIVVITHNHAVQGMVEEYSHLAL